MSDFKLPTNETDGAISNQLSTLYDEIAERLGRMRAVEHTDSAEYRELLAIYVTLSIRELNRFYK